MNRRPVLRLPRALLVLLVAAGAIPLVAAPSRVKNPPRTPRIPSRPAQPPSTASIVALGEELRRIVEDRPLSLARTSVQVLDAASGAVIYSHDPDALLKPASNMKVITSATALAILRPEYRFRTWFYATSNPSASGVVKGDLYIKGGGSPGLVGEEWWLIARRLRGLGITRIDGDLVGDDTYFDDVRRGPKWPSPNVDNPYNAPISALSCYYNCVSVTVRPTAEGRPPEVFLEPFSSFFKVVNKAVTTSRGLNLRVGRQWDGEQNVILVDGRIGTASGPITSNKNVEEPTLYALSAFKEAAAKEGISILGTLRRGAVPSGARLIHVHESKPLSDLVQDMNKESNNFMAESILKALGAETDGTPGTTAKGAAAVKKHLESLGVSTSGLVLADGSGLSSENRITANSLAQILLATARDFQAAPEFMASLPIGGIDGTLDHRMNGGPAVRNVRAKTGYIDGVSSLSGYAWNESGRLLVFSVIVNNMKTGLWDVTRSVDRLCATMVRSRFETDTASDVAPAARER